MINIYLSSKAFDSCIAQESDSFLSKMMFGDPSDKSLITLYVADEALWDKIMNDDSKEFSILKDNCIAYKKGIELANLVKAKGQNEKADIKCNLSSTIFILDISSDIAKNITKKLGVLCFTDDNIPKESSYKSCMKTLKKDEPYSWDSILNNFHSIPVKSIIINDKYLHKHKERAINNIKQIIKCLYNSNNPIENILFLFGSKNENDLNNSLNDRERIASETYNFCKDELKIQIINIEILYCFGNIPLYDALHNRYIISDYGIIAADETLAPFDRKGKSDVLQTINSFTILSSNIPGAGEKWYVTLCEVSKYISSSLISEGDWPRCKLLSNNGEMKNIEPKELKNKLIGLKYDDPCFYLSVPSNNDWANIQIKKGRYSQGPYVNCICARTEELLLEKQSKIQDLFLNMNIERYPQCPDGNNNFYRIIVSNEPNFEYIIVQSPDGSKSVDQKQYTNNCFLNKADAIAIARQIGSILKGVPVKIQ